MAWLAAVERPPGPDDLHRRGGDLQSVYVVPAWRGTGLGARLVHAVVRHAAAAGMAHLTVRSGRRSRTFYLHLGFAEPELLLIRNLSRADVDPGPARSTRG
jgi:GNAT superfamily N-acetyltransferase